MSRPDAPDRRLLLAKVPLAAASLAVASLLSSPLLAAAAAAKKKVKEDDEGDVTPAEDLMREHGVLKRVLLVYDEAGRRLAAGTALPLDAVGDAAGIIRTFIEGYHEKLEEEHLFPRFRKKGLLVPLVETLQRQHEAGRRLTASILQATGSGAKTEAERRALASALAQFTRMYAPHEAREDTVLFPAIRRVVSRNEYDALGEEFEKKEHQLLGKEGFEGMVEKIAAVEKRLGIYDLEQFTPA